MTALHIQYLHHVFHSGVAVSGGICTWDYLVAYSMAQYVLQHESYLQRKLLSHSTILQNNYAPLASKLLMKGCKSYARS